MIRKPSRSALAAISLLCVVLLAACSSGSPFITNVTISPTSASIDAAVVGSGNTQQFKASALYSDGSTKDVTSTTQWASSNSGVASIDATGLATAGTPADTASVTITGTAGGHSSTATLTVVHGIQSIAVTPLAASVAAGLPQKFVAKGTYSTVGGTTRVDDVSTVATWTSGTPATATIDGTGTATTLHTGTTNITAAIGTVTSTPVAVLTVTAAIPQTLQITPGTPSIALGTSTNLTALEMKSDGTTGPLAGTVTWAIAVPADCTPAGAVSLGATGVNGNEAVGGVLVGSCKVTATEGTLTGTATVKVVTGTSHFAYVSDGGGIEGFSVTATAAPYLAPLTPPSVVATTTQQAVVHPNGKYIYSIDSAGDVHLYTVSSAGATALVPQPSPLPNFGGTSLIYAAIDPTGRFIVATDLTGDAVHIAAISSTDGTLGTVNTTTLTGTNSAPERLAIDRLGKYVYVTSDDNQLYAYSISGTPTAPTLTAIANYPTGPSPTGVAVDPADKLVYVANGNDGTAGSNSVSIYQLNSASGALTAQPDFTVPGTPTFVWNVVVDPTSSYLYVLDAGNSGGTPAVPGSVYGFLITDKTTGALGAAVTGSGAATQMEPTGLAMDATGSLIAIDNNFGNPPTTTGSISLLTIGTGGALTAQTPLPLPSGAQPLFVAFLNAP